MESQDVRGTLAAQPSDCEHLYVYVSKCRTINSSEILFFAAFWTLPFELNYYSYII